MLIGLSVLLMPLSVPDRPQDKVGYRNNTLQPLVGSPREGAPRLPGETAGAMFFTIPRISCRLSFKKAIQCQTLYFVLCFSSVSQQNMYRFLGRKRDMNFFSPVARRDTAPNFVF